MGDIDAFSFCQDKIMTTGGEGGMITTNHDDLWERAWSYKDHGKSYDAVYHRQHPPGISLAARIVRHQLAADRNAVRHGRVCCCAKLDARVAVRRQVCAEMLTRCVLPIPRAAHDLARPILLPLLLQVLRVRSPGAACARGLGPRSHVGAINAEGIPCLAPAGSEIYLEKAFDGIRPAQRLPVAKELGETSLMFQVHTTLSQPDLHDTISAVRKVMMAASE